MASGRLSDRLRSRRALLGTSAIADLVARLPADVLAPFVSIGSETLAPARVGFLTGWLLFAVALYTFCPLAYAHLDVLPRRDAGFRATFTACAVALGITLQQFDRGGPLLAVFVPGTFACGGLLLGYLRRTHGWTVTDPGGRAVEVLERVSPHESVAAEIEADLAYGGLPGRLATTTYVLAVSLVLGLPVALAAITTDVSFYAFPVPDVVLLGWAVSARVLPRVPGGPTRDRILALDVDVEGRFIGAAAHATRSVQGMFSTTFVILGLVLSGGYLYIAVTLAPRVAGLLVVVLTQPPSVTSVETLRSLWNWIGVLVLLFGAGSLGLWAWTRELQRLPAFLDAREDRTSRDDVDPVTRVHGLTLLPVTGFLLAAAFLTTDAASVASIHAVLWPFTVVVGAWTVRRTRRSDAQSVSNEHHWIASGFILQTVTFRIGTRLDRVRDALLGGDSLPAVLAVPVAWTLFLLLVASVPLLERYERRHDDVRRYGVVGVVIAFGLLAAGGLTVIPARYRPFALAFVGVGVGCGILLGVVRYFEL